ncbi:MAG: hemerythrin domain-containing protein, partial [Chloroflexota bacterium]
MSDVSGALGEEHQRIAKKIEFMRRTADSVGEATREALVHDIDRIDEFLLHQLLPHALAEEEILYAAVGKILGTP